MYLFIQQLCSLLSPVTPKSFGRRSISLHLSLLLLFLTCSLFTCHTSVQSADLIKARNVVKIMALLSKKGRNQTSIGTGFVLNNEGYIATNHHVAGNMTALFVVINGQRVNVRDGFDIDNKYKNTNVEKKPWSSGDLDLAIIKIKPEYLEKLNLQPVTLTNKIPQQGKAVTAIGYPGIAEKTIAQTSEVVASSTYSKGEIARIIEDGYWKKGGQSMVQLFHTVPIARGNSGGPLFDECGRVVGVNTIKPVEASAVYDKKGKEVGVSYIQNAAYGVASSINELIEVLDSRDINYSIDNSICHSRQEKFEEENKKLSQILQFTLYIGGGAFIAIGILLVYLFRKPESRQKVQHIVETYSRSIGRSKHNKVPGDSQSSSEETVYTPHSTGATQSQASLILDGYNPEHKRFRLIIPAEQLYKGELTVGREPDNPEYKIEESSVSRKHCSFFMRGKDLYIRDENSTNGTFVNGRQLVPSEKAPLFSGAEIKLGSVTFKVISG